MHAISHLFASLKVCPQIQYVLAKRSAQESYGHILSILNPNRGAYLVQQSKFHQHCYTEAWKDSKKNRYLDYEHLCKNFLERKFDGKEETFEDKRKLWKDNFSLEQTRALVKYTYLLDYLPDTYVLEIGEKLLADKEAFKLGRLFRERTDMTLFSREPESLFQRAIGLWDSALLEDLQKKLKEDRIHSYWPDDFPNEVLKALNYEAMHSITMNALFGYSAKDKLAILTIEQVKIVLPIIGSSPRFRINSIEIDQLLKLLNDPDYFKKHAKLLIDLFPKRSPFTWATAHSSLQKALHDALALLDESTLISLRDEVLNLSDRGTIIPEKFHSILVIGSTIL